MIDLARALARCGLFRGFDEGRLAALTRAATEIPLAAGAVLFREGEPGDAMYVVLAGAIQVYTRDRDGREVVLRRLEAGDHVGEQSLLPGTTGRRSASVRAAEPARLARVPKPDFQAALAADDALHERLLALREDQVRHSLQMLSPLARGIGLEAVAARPRALADGEVLFREGDDADALYFVSAGRLAVWRDESGRRSLIRVVERGGCVGELALLRRDRRSATVTARGPAEVLAVPRAAFDEVYGRSEAVRRHLATLERVYELPRRGLVTQHAGGFAGHDCITTLYHLTDGRVFAAYRAVGQDLYALEQLGADVAETLAWRDDAGRSRELRLASDATVVGLTARGAWPDAHALQLFVLDGGALGAAQRAGFARSGAFDVSVTRVAEDVVCHCVDLTAETLRAAIDRGAATFDRLQKATGCGTVCGGCVPAVTEILGAEEWVLADVVSEHDESLGVRSFELAPRAARYPDAEPGQHVVVEGLVNGLRLRRPYTLSSARRHAGRLRITVKRETGGAFSRWLFDERPKEEPLRITRPRGDYVIDLAAGPVVCLAAGIGVTPALAAARTATGDARDGRLLIHYSGRSRDRMACLPELEAAARPPNVELVVRETARQGRLDAAAVADLVARIPGASWYLCGPARYLDDVARLLQAAGVAGDRIRVETFTPVGSAPAVTADERAAVARYFLVPPAPAPARPAVRALRRGGVALVALANSPLTDWRVGGAQLNPLRRLERRIGRAAGLDAAVPHEHLAIVSALSWGPFDYQLRGFERIAALGAANRERARRQSAGGGRLPPDTPDGETFSYVMPAVPLVKFPRACAVDTGWTRPAPGRVMPVYVTRSRPAIEHLLRRAEHTDRGAIPYHYLQQVLGRTDLASCPGRKAAGLFGGQMNDNATWAEDRALTTDMFGFPSIDGFGPGMEAVVGDVCATIDDFLARDPDAVVDLNVVVSKVAYTIIVRAVFGDVDLAEMHALGRTLSESFRKLLGYIWEFVMGRQSVPADYVEAQRGARDTVRAVIDLLRDLDRQGRLTAAQRALPPVRLVLEAAGDPAGAYERLYALVLPLVLAGHETTGHAVSWALYEAVRRPALEAAVLDEIRSFRTAHGGRPLTTADYDERPLSWALLAEVLRRHSPVGSIPRTTTQAGVVPPDADTGIGGFRYPPGAMVIFSMTGIHLDPRRWPDPQAFRIERWLDGVRDGMSVREQGRLVRANIRAREQALDWLPFADGPGRCPGQHFNAHEFFVLLDAMLSRYRLELANPAREVPHSETMIVGPEPGLMAVRIRRRPRSSA
ncbi:MAG: cytochrome P450 [Candidatus Rokuibacteriota bacterium]